MSSSFTPREAEEMEVNQSSYLEGAKEEEKKLVVILVGAPGSGKSTFCEQVMKSPSRQWSRVCQDTINKGKSGTRAQCLKSAMTALDEGKSVLIDRCNLDKAQRADFVKLGGSLIDVHAVVLDLPTQLCISRSVKRTGHEGNLQGGKAGAVVNTMLRNKELPILNEGFARIVVCQKDNEVASAVTEYSNLGRFQSLPTGYFQESKTTGIMKYFTKTESQPSLTATRDNKRSMDEEDDRGPKLKRQSWGSWAQSLFNIAKHPESQKNGVLEILDQVIVLNDMYPKAEKHLLVLAREEGVDSLSDVGKEHVKLLTTMHEVALKWVDKLISENPSLGFRIGFHSVPSMRQLHLHVISQDFNSHHMKNKKHWNSFTTPFFKDSLQVIEDVRKHGKPIINGHIADQLRCHRCGTACATIPKLKSHILSCSAPFPSQVILKNNLPSFQLIFPS